ncbi:addiction module toxin RelE [Pseudomonas sp. o96-267]|uniref:type II toxin-antitoxin system RelE/ParE family toxin n=1 Tax=Pseudomonas sp. o96-267 TaxID=2479853 RepID=UPI000F7A8996|nr:type II toxin-antitoxin system RelE/ParE family toxin [Pseudomonas sp. o96-267]RRV42638.1 addiction module toxin RelE [Pseudomonas sp. o96-267]
MAWDVEYTDEFGDWWESLSADEQESVAVSVRLLEERGPSLGFPHSSGINGSRHGHMRELRTQHVGRPYRTLYAFDPRRSAILLIGGSKAGDDRWYEINVPLADRLYDEHLEQLRKEGLIDGYEICRTARKDGA